MVCYIDNAILYYLIYVSINNNLNTHSITLFAFYLIGTLGAEQVYRQLIQVSKNKDTALTLFPYCIGALPRGDKKSKLNQYYQQQ